mmetsp:Transcript_39576/g.77357  ORF Transcript_39576/g.77357 Transcript_39576/m.77357 type:complete len:204 (-) Transcript_39576:319-930(-)
MRSVANDIASLLLPPPRDSNTDLAFRKNGGFTTCGLYRGEKQVPGLSSADSDSMSDYSSGDTPYRTLFTRHVDAPSGVEHSTAGTQNIPFPKTHIKRTDSEHKLIQEKAHAEVRDLKMFCTILTGVQRINFINPFTKKTALDRILRRRSEDLSEYTDCLDDAISAMSVSRSDSHDDAGDNGNRVEQDWILGDTFQDCIFEMDL